MGSNSLDCIVGMAPSTGGFRGDSFPLRLMSSGKLSSKVVSYYIDGTYLSGELIYGGVDTTNTMVQLHGCLGSHIIQSIGQHSLVISSSIQIHLQTSS